MTTTDISRVCVLQAVTGPFLARVFEARGSGGAAAILLDDQQWIPAQWVRDDGPDRLKTATGWEASIEPTLAQALEASRDPQWWAGQALTNELAVKVVTPARDILFAADWAPAEGFKINTDANGEVELLHRDDASFELSFDCINDDGQPLYLWSDYAADAEFEDWENLGSGAGTEQEARAAVAAWVANVRTGK